VAVVKFTTCLVGLLKEPQHRLHRKHRLQQFLCCCGCVFIAAKNMFTSHSLATTISSGSVTVALYTRHNIYINTHKRAQTHTCTPGYNEQLYLGQADSWLSKWLDHSYEQLLPKNYRNPEDEGIKVKIRASAGKNCIHYKDHFISGYQLYIHNEKMAEFKTVLNIYIAKKFIVKHL
jgi:hypothetical protein